MRLSLEDEIKVFLNLKKSAVILPVRNKKQINGWSCGSTSLKMVFSYWGTHYTVTDISEWCGTSEEIGTKFKKIVQVARDEGMQADVIRNGTAKEVRRYINAKIPLITCHQFTPIVGDTHYSVLIGYDDDNFIFSEPARWEAYYIKKRIRSFIKTWKDLEGDTRGDGIAIYPKTLDKLP